MKCRLEAVWVQQTRKNAHLDFSYPLSILDRMKASFFKKAGRLGGETRARNLSPGRRSEIASRAAAARWRKTPAARSRALMESVRFNAPNLEDPAYLEEVLLDGSVDDWKPIYEAISDRPFGAVATALDRVLKFTQGYGVIPLWTGILSNVRGAS